MYFRGGIVATGTLSGSRVSKHSSQPSETQIIWTKVTFSIHYCFLRESYRYCVFYHVLHDVSLSVGNLSYIICLLVQKCQLESTHILLGKIGLRKASLTYARWFGNPIGKPDRKTR